MVSVNYYTLLLHGSISGDVLISQSEVQIKACAAYHADAKCFYSIAICKLVNSIVWFISNNEDCNPDYRIT